MTFRAALLFCAALVVCTLAYLAVAVPGPWFPQAPQRTWSATELKVVRGTGQIAGSSLMIAGASAGDITIISLPTRLRSADYRAIAWRGAHFPPDADVRLLWQTDYESGRLNTMRVPIESGELQPVLVSKDSHWVGTITGIALAVRGPLPQPASVEGVAAKPMGALELLGDRAREWLALEAWSGTSINTIVGGAEVQPLPLPLLVACAIGIAGLGAAGLQRWRPGVLGASLPVLLAGFFLTGWFLLDGRWTGNLARQERLTWEQYGGKTAREKHLASEDATLYAFIEKVQQVLPSTPVRILVASDIDYFRYRAAYHLYPHSVLSGRSNELPSPDQLRPGDWVLVFERRGIQYDPEHRLLRWNAGTPVRAELKLLERPGGALFRIE